jgi:hypothetical protein
MAWIMPSIGIYSVASFGVSQRPREFGVRLGMGATASDVCPRLCGAVFLIGRGLALGKEALQL